MTVAASSSQRGWAFGLAASILKPLLSATKHAGSTARRSRPPAAASWSSTTSRTSTPADGALRLRPRPDPALPRQVRAVPQQGSSAFLRAPRPDPGRAAEPHASVRTTPRSRPSRGRVRRRLSRGHADPRPRPVADDRQDRRRPDRAETGCPVIPVGQWGAGAAAAVHEAPTSSRARHHDEGRRPGALDDLLGLPRVATTVARGHRPDHGRDHRDRRGDPRREGPGRSASTRARASRDRQPATPRGRKKRRNDDQGRGLRCRVVGDRLLDRAGRRRQRRVHVGPARRGRARRSTTSARTPTTCPASSSPPTSVGATHDPRSRRRRGRRRARRAVADACARTSPSGRRCSRTDATWSA